MRPAPIPCAGRFRILESVLRGRTESVTVQPDGPDRYPNRLSAHGPGGVVSGDDRIHGFGDCRGGPGPLAPGVRDAPAPVGLAVFDEIRRRGRSAGGPSVNGSGGADGRPVIVRGRHHDRALFHVFAGGRPLWLPTGGQCAAGRGPGHAAGCPHPACDRQRRDAGSAGRTASGGYSHPKLSIGTAL